MDYEWNFSAVLAHYPAFLSGAANTGKLVAGILALASPVGLLLGLIRYQRIPILAKAAVIYIDFFRTSVALVLICWCYYALPVLLGIQIDTYLAVTLALGLQASAFVAEIVRGGIESIAKGQWEACRALGMSASLTMSRVILPQATRRMIPVFFLMVIEITKNTTLAGVVTYNELFYNAFDVSSTTFRPFETFTVLGAIYLIVLFSASQLVRRLERRLKQY